MSEPLTLNPFLRTPPRRPATEDHSFSDLEEIETIIAEERNRQADPASPPPLKGRVRKTLFHTPAAPQPPAPPSKKPSSLWAHDSDSSPEKTPPKTRSRFFGSPTSPSSEDETLNQSFGELDLDDLRMPSNPVTPTKSNNTTPPQTPFSKFSQYLDTATPDFTFTPTKQEMQEEAEERIAEFDGEQSREAYQTLIAKTVASLERAVEFTVVKGQGRVVGLTNLKEGYTCWFLEVLKISNKGLGKFGKSPKDKFSILLLNLTHMLDLDTSESGQSVRGKHIHASYLPGACINPESGVWCASLSASKKTKFSTYLPLKYQSLQEITDLVNLAIEKGTIIAENKGKYLIQVPSNPVLFLEIPIRNGVIIPTVMPVLHYGDYEENKVLKFDPDITIPLKAVLPFIKSAQPLYTLKDGSAIIDIAPLLSKAGIPCPIEKGILIKVQSNFML